MAVSGYFFRAFFALLLMVSFGKNAAASGFELTAEERAIIEQEQRAQEERELHAAMAASHHDHAAKNAARERLQIEMALAADAHAQQLKQEADDLERALELSRESHRVPAAAPAPAPDTAIYSAEDDDEDLEAALALSMERSVPAAAAVAPPQLSERELRMERMKHFQSAPPVEQSIDEQVESTFEKDMNKIKNEIDRLESLKLGQRYGSNDRKLTDKRLNELKIDLQNYTLPSKVTATKLRLKSYISRQQRK